MHPLLSRAVLALVLPAALAGCDTADTPAGPATLRLHVQGVAGGAPLVAGQTFTVDGRAARLDIAHLYLSGITLLHEDGREIAIQAETPVTVRAQTADGTDVQHTVTDRVVLADLDAGATTTAPLGAVPSGRYRGVRLRLGVDGLDNRAAVEDFPAGHPLGAQDPSMHWSWNSGYVFLRLDGLLDVDGDGTPDPAAGAPGDPASGQWRLHVGLSANVQTLTLDTPFALVAGETQALRLEVDLARLVQGLDYNVPATRFCMTGGCQPVVDAVTANTAAAFTLQGVQP